MTSASASRLRVHIVGSSTMRRAVGLVVTTLAFLLFAPVDIGGAASYVTVEGTSMEPNLRAGDVVMLVERRSYHVGDVVAYRSQSLAGAVVIHRIIGIDAGRFVTQGDNNDFIDEYRPIAPDVLGEQRLRVPRAAWAIDIFRTPIGFGSIVVLGGLLLLQGSQPTPIARRRRRCSRGLVP